MIGLTVVHSAVMKRMGLHRGTNQALIVVLNAAGR